MAFDSPINMDIYLRQSLGIKYGVDPKTERSLVHLYTTVQNPLPDHPLALIDDISSFTYPIIGGSM